MFFYAVLRGVGAKNALELGTSTGYSTLWIAAALLENTKNPKILTIEKNPAKIVRAQHNFRRAGVLRYIDIRQGHILGVLAAMPKKETFDFVLIDADKENGRAYFDLVLPLLRVGGIIATDNMLYPAKYRKIMKKYSDYIFKNTHVRTVTLPIGNGQEITVKIK
jgi:predicted O-methyltransferase YrrM